VNAKENARLGMKKILFVCTGNSCRSVMAEGLFKHLTADRAGEFSVSSAGTGAVDGYPASDQTIRVMKDEGVDVSEHQSRRLTSEMVESADRIYVMEMGHKDFILCLCPEAAGKVFLLTEFSSRGNGSSAEIDIPDPIQMSDSFYKNVLFIIRGCIGKIVESL
jgi:protein-tyrosine phosphatase